MPTERPSASLAQVLFEAASDPDTVMLPTMLATPGCNLSLPAVFIMPLLQSGVFLCFGDDLAGREYPMWWLPALAGYGTYAAGIVGAIALAIAGNNATGGGSLSAPGASATPGSSRATAPRSLSTFSSTSPTRRPCSRR